MGNSSSSATPAKKEECEVCATALLLSDKTIPPFLRCRFGHSLCQECTTNYINITWMNKPVDIGSVPDVSCPDPKCGIVFREHQIARVVDEETFQAYLDKKMSARDGMVLANMRQQLSSLSPEELENQAELDRTILAQQLKAQLCDAGGANIVQCPRCKFGPIEAMHCWDLASHHGESRRTGGVINNQCPQCGFFARDRNEWHKWDGVLTNPKQSKKMLDQQKDIMNKSLVTGIVVAALFVCFMTPLVSFWAILICVLVSFLCRGVMERHLKDGAVSTQKKSQ